MQNTSNNTQSPLDQLMQALKTVAPGVVPQVAQPQGQQQQQLDPNQLFQSLITGAIQQKNSGKRPDYSQYQVPMDTPGTLMHEKSHPIESQATSQALANGADPNLLDRARQFLGKNAYVGLCEAFVERMTQGAEGIYRSAIDAWNQHQGSRQQGLAGVKPGDAVYFAPDASNQGYGHTGVYMGNGQFISATDNGIRQYNLNDWQKMTGQKLLGYVPQDSRVQQARSQLYPQQPRQQTPMTIPSVTQQKLATTQPNKPQTPPVQQPQLTRPNPLAFLGPKPQQQSPLSFLNRRIG